MINYYSILGVSENATIEEIHKRYRFLVQAYHPDRFLDKELKAQAEEEMKRINAAYETLSNIEKRKKYSFDHKKNSDFNPENTYCDSSGDLSDSSYVNEYIDFLDYLKTKWFEKISQFLTDKEIERQIKLISDDVFFVLNKLCFGQSQDQVKKNYTDIGNYILGMILVNLAIGAEISVKSLPENIKLEELMNFMYLPIYAKLESIWNVDIHHFENEHFFTVSTTNLLEKTLDISYSCQKIGSEISKEKYKNPDSFSREPVQANHSKKQKFSEGFCQSCSQLTDVKKVVLDQNIGLIFLRLSKHLEASLCAECVEAKFWEFTAITLFLGWWGIKSLILTPFILIGNTIQYLTTREMRMKSYKNLLPIASGWKAIIALLFIALFFTFIPSKNSGINASYATPFPTQRVQLVVPTKDVDAILPVATKTINPKPTITPLNTCKAWNQITASDAGKKICFKGIVKEVYWGNDNIFHLRFGPSNNDFRLIGVNWYYKDIVNSCVTVTGVVKAYGKMPYIEVSGLDLEICNY